MQINDIILSLNDLLWGWPMILIGVGVGLLITAYLRGVQFRYFFTAWRLLLTPKSVAAGVQADMTPFQAFLNALSASVGNGSIAGMATAVYSGGPGVAVWIFLFGLLSMAIRYCEVYLSTAFGTKKLGGGVVGGPMVYLSKVPGGSFLPYFYALFCLLLALASGNAMQVNSIRIGLVRILPVSALVVALILLAFITYVMLGGAQRIVKVSDKIVPVKVGVFFVSAVLVLAYHYKAILPALKTIIAAAFTPQAVIGAVIGLSIQRAMRFGIARSLNASEAGLGTAAVIFGGSGSVQPVKDGIMSMLSSFITANLICFSIVLMIVVSGVWNNGQTSLDLAISAYETVFGSLGGWIVTFISVTFGIGTLVTYAYIARNCWLFLTGGKFTHVLNFIYCAVTFLGTLASVDLVWNSTDLVNAGLLSLNLYGILMLLPAIATGLRTYEQSPTAK
jgi:AGCS family alanine or glycine:cation symporter